MEEHKEITNTEEAKNEEAVSTEVSEETSESTIQAEEVSEESEQTEESVETETSEATEEKQTEEPEKQTADTSENSEQSEAEAASKEAETKKVSGIRAAWRKVCAGFHTFFGSKNNLYTAIICVALPIILTLIIEMLARNSFLEGFKFLFEHPLPFFVSASIIACTVLIALIFRRRFFVYLIVSAFWIVMGIVNQQILSRRVTPFNGTDIFMVKTGMRIMEKYYSPGTIILYAVLAALLIAFLVYVWIKGPKIQGTIRRVRNALICAAMVGVTFILISISLDTGQIARTFNNLPNAYNAYGFTYCFLNSVFDNGVRRPSGYSDEQIVKLVDSTEEKADEITQVTDKTPNIIIIQLESFFDITRMDNLEFSKDPIPFFRSLMESESCGSGFISVPSIGAGTSNTEFEVLTGMNLEDFGAGEIPYKGVLLDKTCESIAYNVSENGYTTHAIHNNDATFYQRHTVYPHLGFDTFTSMEYMYLTSNDYTPKKWVRDEVLTEHIIDCLDSTPDSVDFVFTVSVEGHGSYPNVYTPGMDTVRVTETGTGETQYAVQFFTNLMYDMDQFIEELVTELSARDEETILFLYGDHLPSLGLEQEHMKTGDLQQTEYVIWNNMGLNLQFGDLEAYQVMPQILGALGIDNGVINSYHIKHMTDEEGEYLSGLQNLEYDLLYGKQTALAEHGPYISKDMRFGVKDVTITEINPRTIGGEPYIYITGENFTKWSMANINGQYYKTELLNPQLIRVKYEELLPQDEIFVAQVGDDKYQLSATAPFIYQ